MNNNPKKFAQYIAGGVIGALLGISAIYLLEKSNEINEEETVYDGKMLARVGLGAVSFLYSLIGKGKGKGKRLLK